MTCVSDISSFESETDGFLTLRPFGLDPGDRWRSTAPIAQRNCLGSSNLRASRRMKWGINPAYKGFSKDTMDTMEVGFTKATNCWRVGVVQEWAIPKNSGYCICSYMFIGKLRIQQGIGDIADTLFWLASWCCWFCVAGLSA